LASGNGTLEKSILDSKKDHLEILESFEKPKDFKECDETPKRVEKSKTRKRV
jgi:hypothetical protein